MGVVFNRQREVSWSFASGKVKRIFSAANELNYRQGKISKLIRCGSAASSQKPFEGDGVRRGESLSAACEREDRLLPPWFCGMVSLGETSGSLPASFERIASLHPGRRVGQLWQTCAPDPAVLDALFTLTHSPREQGAASPAPSAPAAADAPKPAAP